MRLKVLVALGALSPKQREALWDMDVLGRTSEAIAADWGCLPQNVRECASRARKNLALMLGKDAHEMF